MRVLEVGIHNIIYFFIYFFLNFFFFFFFFFQMGTIIILVLSISLKCNMLGGLVSECCHLIMCILQILCKHNSLSFRLSLPKET
jgi:hypothetical protein